MKKFSKLFVLIFAVLALCAAFSSCASPVGAGEAQAVISDDGKSLVIDAAFTDQEQSSFAGKTVYLFRLDAGSAAYDLASLTPIAEAKMAPSLSFSLKISGGRAALTSSYILAVYDGMQNAYSPVSDRLFIKNPEKLASDTSAPSTPVSIKGVCAESTSLAISLGVSHAVIDLPIEEYITQPSESAIRADVGGESRFFDAAAIARLDKRVSALRDSGASVYLRIYLGKCAADLPDELKYLSYDGTEEGEKYYHIDLGDREAFLELGAFCELLAARYASSGELSVILGQGANSAVLGSEQADILGGSFAEEYAVALRTCHNILRSHSARATVYAAIDNRLTSARTPDHTSGEGFLSAIDNVFGRDSDFAWGVFAECGSGIATGDRVWYDTEELSVLTPTNISSLTEGVLGREALLFDGKTRSLVLGVSIPSVIGSAASQTNQSVSYAYTYFRALKNGHVRALIYTSVYDTENDGSGIVSGNIEKQICAMLRKVDTDADVADSAGELIGSPWNEIFADADLKDRASRGKYMFGAGSLGSSAGYELSPLFDFSDGSASGFTTVGGGYVALSTIEGTSALSAHFDTLTGERRGGLAVFGVDPALIGGEYLMIPLSVMPDGDAVIEGNYELTLTIMQNDPNGEVRNYYSGVTVSPYTRATAVFDISAFSAAKTDRPVTIMLTVEPPEDMPFVLNVEKILSAKQPSFFIWIVVLVAIGVLVLAAAVTVFVIWFRKNYSIDFSAFRRKKKDTDCEE